MFNSYQEIDRKEYLEIRNWYAQRIFYASDTFDKTIMTLSISVLWASLLFINNKKEIIGGLKYLIFAWIFLALTILISLISFLLGERSNRDSLDRYDAEYLQKSSKELEDYDSKILVKSKIIWIIKILTIIFLILWVCFLVLFFYSNIPVHHV